MSTSHHEKAGKRKDGFRRMGKKSHKPGMASDQALRRVSRVYVDDEEEPWTGLNRHQARDRLNRLRDLPHRPELS